MRASVSGKIVAEAQCPNTPPHIIELAREGATHRLAELQAEIVELIKSFPHLKSQKKPYPLDLEERDLPHATKRRRRPGMSAAQRKAVSLRMKKYWAARRKAKS